jgi:homoserine dehydrogenase
MQDIHIVVDLTEWTEDAPDLDRAKEAAEETLREKSLVLSSPLFVSRFLRDFYQVARRHRRSVLYEAASGLRFPVLRIIRDQLPPDPVRSIFCRPANILNAFIDDLSKHPHEPRFMTHGRSGTPTPNWSQQSQALRRSTHRLSILSSIGLGVRFSDAEIPTVGIHEVLPLDFDYAQDRLGQEIAFLEIVTRGPSTPTARAGPCLVDGNHLIAKTRHYDTIVVDSEMRGPTILRGTGTRAPASLVMSDLTLIARGTHSGGGLDLREASIRAIDADVFDYYLRFVVRDRPGIVGVIGRALGSFGLNLDQILQLGHSVEEIRAIKQRSILNSRDEREGWSSKLAATPESEVLPFVVTVKQAEDGRLRQAISQLNNEPFMLLPTFSLRTEVVPSLVLPA